MGESEVKCPDCKGKAELKSKKGFILYEVEYLWFYCPKCKKNFLAKFPKS